MIQAMTQRSAPLRVAIQLIHLRCNKGVVRTRLKHQFPHLLKCRLSQLVKQAEAIAQKEQQAEVRRELAILDVRINELLRDIM
ncbi:MAG: hypothetical protein ACKO96_00665 [Flammeovirgaceae bacterium]